MCHGDDVLTQSKDQIHVDAARGTVKQLWQGLLFEVK